MPSGSNGVIVDGDAYFVDGGYMFINGTLTIRTIQNLIGKNTSCLNLEYSLKIYIFILFL